MKFVRVFRKTSLDVGVARDDMSLCREVLPSASDPLPAVTGRHGALDLAPSCDDEELVLVPPLLL